MKFGLGLSVQHSPDDSQAGRLQEHLEQVRLASAVGYRDVENQAMGQDPMGRLGRLVSDFEALARDRFLLGDPARVREEIARYRDTLGVTAIIVRVQ